MAYIRKLFIVFLIPIYAASCGTTNQPTFKKTSIADEQAAWEKQRQKEQEGQALALPTLTPPITPVAEGKITLPDSSLDVRDEQYEFFISEDTRYLKCRFKLYTGQNQSLKLFYFIVARNLDYQYKIEQSVPPEVVFDKQNKPNYSWGYEIEATDSMQLENIIPRPSDQLHYNHLTYYFYDTQGRELLRYQVKLNYTESQYILENMKNNNKVIQMPDYQ